MIRFFKAISGLLIFFIAIIKEAHAQVDTSTTQKLLQYIMQPLDKNQISTGYLEEYGCPILPMATFNGTLTDSNTIDMNLLRTLYFQLQTGWIKASSNPLPSIAVVNDSVRQNSGTSSPIAIPIVVATYNSVKADAFTSNLLYHNTSTKQVQDVENRASSPYITNALFAACPNKKYSRYGSESFIIKPGMIWNNTGKTISQVQIDFANGDGFQTVTIGTAVNVTYSDTGLKRWTIKVTLNDNSVLQCYSDYNVLQVSLGARFGSQIQIPSWGFVSKINGNRGGATVFVNYSSNNPSGTLRKPLIVVEGYDISSVAPNLQDNYWIGDFISAISQEPGVSFDFNESLDDLAGYDLVFVDFEDGAEDIVLNAMTVQEVINRVNANKVLDNRFGNIRQQNVVMGISMGGLCSRYALANMTKNFATTQHEVRLLITHDSPHRGANVPLGLQHTILMTGNVNLFGTTVRDIFPEYDQFINLLAAPATQQMLIYRAISETQMTNNTFLDGAYRNMITFGDNDPVPSYKFIATSQGNECANPIFSEYTKLLDVDANGLIFYFPILSAKIRAKAESFALPSTGSTNKISYLKAYSAFKLFGIFPINKTYYENTAYANGNQLPIDGIAGGTNPVGAGMEPLDINRFVILPPVLLHWGYLSVHVSGTPGNFTFVPVVSALDVATFNITTFAQKYTGGINPLYPSRSANFIAQETVQGQPAVSNNAHIRFTARNSRWMFNEMENITPNTENCSSECQATGFYISGDANLCSGSKTYTLNSLHPSATITWNASPSGVVSLVTNSDKTVTVTKVGNGLVTLTGSATSCGIQTGTITKQITVGPPPTPSIHTVNYLGNDVQLFATAYQGASYNWYENNVLTEANGTYVYYTYLPCGQSRTVQVEAFNACGTSSQGSRFITMNCGPRDRFSVSPNPASSEVSVKIVETETSINSNTIQELQITDNTGTIKLHKKYSKGTKLVKIGVGQLLPGTYFVRIYDGKEWQSQQLIIQR